VEDITLLAIDIAKNVFQLQGRNKIGKVMLNKRLKRNQLMPFIGNLPSCTIVMEACGSAHYWARKFTAYHQVKLISPQHVTPFRKGQKNDQNDAGAIAEAASRPTMVYVPLKSVECQDIQSIHRMRALQVKQQTMLACHIRGLLAEYGITVSIGIHHLRKQLPIILEDQQNELTIMMRTELVNLYENLLSFKQQIDYYDKQIKKIAHDNPVCQKLMKLRGVGEKIATIMVADLGDGKAYQKGRQYAANLGLTPKQHSSGDRQRLGGISKRGDSYVRQLLIHGARSVLKQVKNKEDKLSIWLQRILAKGGTNKASVALANKNARVIWAIVANQSSFNEALMTG
jgi:transposase